MRVVLFLCFILPSMLFAGVSGIKKEQVAGGVVVDWESGKLTATVSLAPSVDRDSRDSLLDRAKERWMEVVEQSLKHIPLSYRQTADSCLSPAGSPLLDSEMRHAVRDASITWYGTGAIDFKASLSMSVLAAVCGLTSNTGRKQPHLSVLVVDLRHVTSFHPALSIVVSAQGSTDSIAVVPAYVSGQELIDWRKKTKTLTVILPQKVNKDGTVVLDSATFEQVKHRRYISVIVP